VQCSAHSKRSGAQCKRSAVPGRTVCSVHGGKSPQGIASPSFQHGRYSKALPTRLAARYQQAREDPDLLAMRDEVALFDARLAELLGRLDTGESATRWLQVQAFVDELASEPGEDVDELVSRLAKLQQLVRAGSTEADLWSEIGSLVEQRRKLVESERKRLVDLQQVITAERAMTLIALITDSVRRHVRDRDALAAISADLGALLTAPGTDLAHGAGRRA
jgi:hypothetical protein